MSKKGIALYLAAFLVYNAIAVSAQEKAPRRLVSEKLIVHSNERIKDLTVSKDGRRLAYIAQVGDKLAAVIDGRKEKAYDDIAEMNFSPDSQRVAYGASEGDEWLVVVDGKEEKRYDG